MAIRKRKKPNLVLPLTSMGDIAFLLIIFFMMASNFMKSANIEIDKPHGVELEQQESPKCSVIIDKDRMIWYEGVQSTANEVKAQLQDQAERDHGYTVHVSVHKELQKKDFMPLIRSISESGAKMILTGEPED